MNIKSKKRKTNTQRQKIGISNSKNKKEMDKFLMEQSEKLKIPIMYNGK